MKTILSTFSPPPAISTHSAIHGINYLQQAYNSTPLSKGHTLFQEESFPHHLFYLRQGVVKLHQYGNDGKEQIVRLLGAGEFIGYTELLNNTQYHVSATVLKKALVAAIPKADFLKFFEKERSVSQYFTQLLCRDLVEADRRLVALAYQPVRGRLAHTLLLLDSLFESKNPDDECIINISRQDLASLMGVAKETVIRLLSEFKSKNMITTCGQSIAVLNTEELQRMAENSYD